MLLSEGNLFTLQERKEYTFEEAFKDIENQLIALEQRGNRQLRLEVLLELQKHRQALLGIIQDFWKEYLDSYRPTMYIRTGKTLQGIRIDPSVKENGRGGYDLRIIFDDSMMYRNRHTYMAINDGWNYGGSKHRYDYYEGYHQLEKALAFYEKGNRPDWIDIQVNWKGSIRSEH